jgi:hypothetical protein
VNGATVITYQRYMTRERLPERRHTWRQKVRIIDDNSGLHVFYVEFGEYADGRLGEVFITAHKTGTFVRGTLDTLAQSISVALQSGTAPLEMAKMLLDQDYPPKGTVEADGSDVTECCSLADYIGQEIVNCYGEDGKRLPWIPPPEKGAGYKPEDWRTGI